MSLARIAIVTAVAAIALPVGSAAAAQQCGWVNTVKVKANNSVTSCAFARNIARSWLNGAYSGNFDPFSSNSTAGNVYSPVTGLTYYVRCYRSYNRGGYLTVWGCYGGNNASTRLTYYAE